MSWEDSKHKRIVIDNGGYQVKMSTAAEKHPILVLNAVGQLKSKIKQK
jgi:actin-related protein